MSIFKKTEFMNEDQIKKAVWLKRVYNLMNRALMIIGLIFNFIMAMMMIVEGSGLFFLFVINTWFLISLRNGRKFKVD